MKKLLLGLMLGVGALAINVSAGAHSGGTNGAGCHNESRYGVARYHCHTQKYYSGPSYYLKYQGKSYGPYSSYNSCHNAVIRYTNGFGFCSMSR